MFYLDGLCCGLLFWKPGLLRQGDIFFFFGYRPAYHYGYHQSEEWLYVESNFCQKFGEEKRGRGKNNLARGTTGGK